MENTKRKKIGHRHSLSEKEVTVFYNIRMPVSLKRKCIKAGAPVIRDILTGLQIQFCKINGDFSNDCICASAHKIVGLQKYGCTSKRKCKDKEIIK